MRPREARINRMQPLSLLRRPHSRPRLSANGIWAPQERLSTVGLRSDPKTILGYLYFSVERSCKSWRTPPAPPCDWPSLRPISYTHLRAHETDSYLVCRLLLEK